MYCTAARLEVREVQQQTRCVGDAATRLDVREAQPLGKVRCKGVATLQASCGRYKARDVREGRPPCWR